MRIFVAVVAAVALSACGGGDPAERPGYVDAVEACESLQVDAQVEAANTNMEFAVKQDDSWTELANLVGAGKVDEALALCRDMELIE